MKKFTFKSAATAMCLAFMLSPLSATAEQTQEEQYYMMQNSKGDDMEFIPEIPAQVCKWQPLIDGSFNTCTGEYRRNPPLQQTDWGKVMGPAPR